MKNLLILIPLALALTACTGEKTPDATATGTVSTETTETAETSKNVAVATCLKEKGAKLYGTEWCPHCKNQKKVLGKEALDIVGFIDCDKQKGTCQKAGIDGYPTWVIDGKKYPGSQEIDVLAQLGKCSL